MELIDSSDMLRDCHRVIGLGEDLIKKLEQDVDTTVPEKARTVKMVKSVIEIQSNAIRQLAERNAQVNDHLNEIVQKHFS